MMEPAFKTRYLRHARLLGREVAAGDPEAFADALDIVEAFRAALVEGVRGQVEDGYSERDLARASGLARSTLRRRYLAG